MKQKLSISVVLTGISMAGILTVTLAVSLVFIMQMRTLTNDQIETSTQNQTTAIKNNLIQQFTAREQALYQAAAGIGSLFEYSGAAALTAEAVPTEEMRAFLTRIRLTMSDVAQVFMANNIPTFEEGGYAVFSPRWDFPGNYDQRTRPWKTVLTEWKAGS